MGCLVFNPRPDQSGVRINQRHGLPLHVGPHQRPVGVVVFQEWNTCRGYGNDLLWRNVHVVDVFSGSRNVIFLITTHDFFFGKGTVFVQLGVGLGDDVVIFFVGRQVVDLVGNLVRFPRNPPVWCFNEPILVDPGVS